MATNPRKEEERGPSTRPAITSQDALLYLALTIALGLVLYLASSAGATLAASQASCHAEMVLLGCYARQNPLAPNLTFPFINDTGG